MADYESWKAEIKYGQVWVDISSSVDGSIEIFRGRDTWRSDTQPSRMTLRLRNPDQRFSPGNTTSTLALRSAQEIRVSDRWGGVEYPLYHGFLELPVIDEWQKSDTTTPKDQTVAVSAVDKLGRLERARKLVGVLTEHILHEGGGTLVGYWPLNDAAGSTRAEHVGPVAQNPLTMERQDQAGTITPVFGQPLYLTYAAEAGPAGDDGSYVRFDPVMDGSIARVRDRFVNTSITGITTGSGLHFAAAMWMKPDATAGSSLPFQVANSSGIAPLTMSLSTFGGVWQAFVLTNAGPSVTVYGPTPRYGQWQFVAVRLDCTTGAIEFWVDDDVSTGTVGGASTVVASNLLVQSHSPNWATAHVQLYLGVGAFDHDAFLTQLDAGRHGHARQSARDWVEMILSYAGVDHDAMQLDTTASTPMQRARLAGRRPSEVLAEAVQTEGGLLFTSARDHGHRHGDVVLHARQRRYNPPLAATIQLAWLEPPLSFRTDPPVNDMTASRVGAGPAHAQHAASVAEYGVYADTATVDSAVDADPANLAAFTVRLNSAPKQRIPRLTFQLRSSTDPTRAATILGRELGDQCALTGLPSNAPWDVGRFHIEGIRHSISIAGHRIEWNTGPVLGVIPGTPDPYPLVGSARVGPDTRIPY